MKLQDFDFSLPSDSIATEPATPRDSSKLLSLVNEDRFDDFHVSDLPSLLQPNDIMVFNNTKVIPARLIGKRDEARVEVNLNKQLEDGVWRVFARPAKKLRINEVFVVADGFEATVKEKHASGEVTLAFNCQGEKFYEQLIKQGLPPLPPYIKRDAKENDVENYQTIYAEERGAVAAPTAGLHFTKDLFQRLDAKGIKRAYVTLHVGAGTFLPVKTENIHEHQMHAEYCVLTEDVANILNKVKKSGGRIVAVGTTSLRVLESATGDDGVIQAFTGDTNIFITPGYKFKAIDLLMTNFHLPKSTLFMLVSALSGLDRMKAAYRYAIENKYRFYSYGDACLLKNTTA